MEVEWYSVHDDTAGETDLTWIWGAFTVNAVMYDTGEWVIRHSKNNQEGSVLYSRGVYSKDDAIIEAEACMEELAEEHADTEEAVTVSYLNY